MRSQAAAWLARLRSEERTPADEAGFQAWLEEDARHRQAFDLVNTVWEISGGAHPPALAIVQAPGPRARRRSRAPAALAVAATVVLALGLAAFGYRTWIWKPVDCQSYATEVGAQKRVTLADGSVMVLDSASAVKVEMRPQRRQVMLQYGRAHFEVAKDNARPFAVDLGGRQVVAVGTVFDVARDGERASVLLTHGKVLVESAAGRRLISPGDRVSFHRAAMEQDRPDLDNLTAWQSGQAVFENEPLKDAIVEMNRYSRQPIAVADPAIGELHVSGRYRTGDAKGFAVSVATLLSLSVDTQPDRLVLARRPQAPPAG